MAWILSVKSTVVFAIVLFTSCLLSGSTQASTASDRLGQCLVLNSTGADRLALMKWIAFAISFHPTVKDVMAVPSSEVDKSDKEIAAVFTNLLVVKCAGETKAVVSEGSSNGMEIAFQALGAIAGKEVFSSPEMQERLSGFVKYIDESTIDTLGGQ